MIERFPGLLATRQWVQLVGTAAIALRHSQSFPASYSAEGIHAWLRTVKFPEKGPPDKRSANRYAWEYLVERFHVIPHAALTFDVLCPLISAVHADLIAGNSRSIADDLLQAWLGDADASDGSPLREIAVLLVDLTHTQPGEHILCTGRGSTTAAICCLQLNRVPVLDPRSMPVMALVYSLMLDLALEFDGFTSYRDAVAAEIIVPDRSVPDRHREALTQVLRDEARPAVILVPNRILFARSAAMVDLRRSLVDSHRLRAVIGFPQGTLTASDSPFSILWFGSAGHVPNVVTFAKVDEKLHFNFARGQLRTRESTFTGAEEILDALEGPVSEPPWLRQVPHEEIVANDYLLTADRYLGTHAERAVKEAAARKGRRRSLVPLGDVVTVIKSQTLRSQDGPSAVSVSEVSPSEFPSHGFLEEAPRMRHVDSSDHARFKEQILMKHDVLLSTKGTIGRVAIAAPRESSTPMVASPSTVILRLNRGHHWMDPITLFMYLRSPVFQSMLRSVVVGTTIPNVSLIDLRKLFVVIPGPDERETLRRAFEEQDRLQTEIRRLRHRQEIEAAEAWKALDLWVPEKAS